MNAVAWYRQPWPWVLICIPFSAVLFGIVMFSMAMLHPDDLVADNYYKDGMAINAERGKDTRAVVMGVVAESLNLDAAGAVFRIDGVSDDSVRLEFHHVTDQNRDVVLHLYRGSDNLYRTEGPTDVPLLDTAGVWYLELQGMDASWRIQQRIVTPTSRIRMGAP